MQTHTIINYMQDLPVQNNLHFLIGEKGLPAVLEEAEEESDDEVPDRVMREKFSLSCLTSSRFSTSVSRPFFNTVSIHLICLHVCSVS